MNVTGSDLELRCICYVSDQWSPVNPEGKKHYARGFLLQLQYTNESLDKPAGLPELPEVILDKVSLQKICLKFCLMMGWK